MAKFKLTFDMYDKAWHQNVHDRIEKYNEEHGIKTPEEDYESHALYYNAQFDDVPYGEWSKLFGDPSKKYSDKEAFPDFVEFNIGEENV